MSFVASVFISFPFSLLLLGLYFGGLTHSQKYVNTQTQKAKGSEEQNRENIKCSKEKEKE